jgi:hypothetical protein
VRDPRGRGGAGIRHLIDRRTFLGACGAALTWPLLRPAWAGEADARTRSEGLSAELLKALEKSEYAYISPLRSDGRESTCHGEVWYAWLDGAVVVNTAPKTWKARALKRGLDRARIWVGDYGTWKRALGRNEDFRKAPSFDAKATVTRNAALLDRLLAVFDEKYPDEIGEWRDKMRDGFFDGSRLLIRYTPI